jgi:hypothetical protein
MGHPIGWDNNLVSSHCVPVLFFNYKPHLIMSWNWKRIKSVKDLPDFDRAVLLYQKKKGKEYATVGVLKSVDAGGYHWGSGMTGGLFDFASMFGDTMSEDFKPTHWCDVVVPEEEPKFGPIEYDEVRHGMYVMVTFEDGENKNKITKETGTVEFINRKMETFVIRHDKKKASVRIMTECKEVELIEKV